MLAIPLQILVVWQLNYMQSLSEIRFFCRSWTIALDCAVVLFGWFLLLLGSLRHEFIKYLHA